MIHVQLNYKKTKKRKIQLSILMIHVLNYTKKTKKRKIKRLKRKIKRLKKKRKIWILIFSKKKDN